MLWAEAKGGRVFHPEPRRAYSRLWNIVDSVYRRGLAAQQGYGKTWQGQKVQRGGFIKDIRAEI